MPFLKIDLRKYAILKYDDKNWQFFGDGTLGSMCFLSKLRKHFLQYFERFRFFESVEVKTIIINEDL
jgi:hypothetical protein